MMNETRRNLGRCEWFNESDFIEFFEGRIENFVEDMGMWVDYSHLSESIYIGTYKMNHEIGCFDDTSLFRLSAHVNSTATAEVACIYAQDFECIGDMWSFTKDKIIKYFVQLIENKKHIEEFGLWNYKNLDYKKGGR